MKRLLVILFLIPSLAFGAYTEFYCDAASGDNLNAGTGGTNDYTTAGGNWTNSTRVFTVTDGTNPSTKIAANDFCSVYVTSGATVATFVGRVQSVQNATNGTVTFTTAFMGANPSNGTGTMTLKHGGFWKGPNAGTAFPLDRANVSTAMDTNSDQVRINLKNGTSYSISSGISTSTLNNVTVQGYSSSAGDGGRAVIDGSTNSITLVSDTSIESTWADIIFASSATTGSVNNYVMGGSGQTAIRIVSHGARVSGIATTGQGPTLIECEAYSNNTSNTSNRGGIDVFSGVVYASLLRCYSHDNTGSNNSGFTFNNGAVVGGALLVTQCIADSNGLHGFVNVGGTSTNSGAKAFINCDAYNNGTDGLKIVADTIASRYWIENCNFIKNGGKGINNVATGQFVQGYVFNCGYGSGTQANGGANVLGALVESGAITYASGVTPWNAPTTGDFSNVLAAAQGVGRGFFTETDGTNTGTVGHPDIGAAQAQIGCTFPTPTATATATPTSTATATPTATATATFTPTSTPTATATATPTAPIEASYGFSQ